MTFNLSSSAPGVRNIAITIYLIIRERAVLVDGIDLRHFRPDRLALEHRLLLPLGEERDFVVDVFELDVNSRLAGQLLSPVVLKTWFQRAKTTTGGTQRTSTRIVKLYSFIVS
jgi:hypothetical protein